MSNHTQFKLSKQAKKNISKNQAVHMLEDTVQMLAALVQIELINTEDLAAVTERQIITPDFEDKQKQYVRSSAQKAEIMRSAAQHVSEMFTMTEQAKQVAEENKT